MHAHMFRVISALMSFAVALSTVCVGQTEGVPDPNAPAVGQNRLRGRVMSPASSIAHPGDRGVRAHTHLQVFMPEDALPFAGPPFAGLGFETPASLACVYSLVPRTSSCNPNVVTANPTGGFGAIAVVVAFHDPTALADLQTFSTQFGLKVPNLTVVFANGTKPAQDPSGGWELEASLDLEWAHAMAPDAKLFLVEARSNSLSDLLAAESVAGNRVASAGGGEVTNSWGSDEFAGETSFDSVFTTPGVVYFASSGDQPGVEYPAASPNVVAAGGTTTAAIPPPQTFCRSAHGTSAAAVFALLKHALSIKMSSNQSWEPGVEFQTCRSTPIRLLARGCSTLRRCRARAADGSSWEELVSLRLHWPAL